MEELVVAEHIVLAELADGLDVGVERDKLVACVKVGDGELRVVGHERVAVIFVSRVQVPTRAFCKISALLTFCKILLGNIPKPLTISEKLATLLRS